MEVARAVFSLVLRRDKMMEVDGIAGNGCRMVGSKLCGSPCPHLALFMGKTMMVMESMGRCLRVGGWRGWFQM